MVDRCQRAVDRDLSGFKHVEAHACQYANGVHRLPLHLIQDGLDIQRSGHPVGEVLIGSMKPFIKLRVVG